MFEGELELTIEEEDKIQNQANIYSLIRTLQFIEKAYSFSRVDRETYMKETNILLEQYKTSVEAFPNYKLDDFVNEYKLHDCQFAINRIKQGTVQAEKKASMKDVATMTQCLNDINVVLQDDNPQVQDILEYYNNLYICLQNLKNCINLDHEDIKKVINRFLDLKNNKTPTYALTEEEKATIKMELSIANSTISQQL